MATRNSTSISHVGNRQLPPSPFDGDPYSDLLVLFRPIPGFPGYAADTDGNIWSCRSPKGFVRQWRRLIPGNCRGYALYGLCGDGRRTTILGHTLILRTFVGPRPHGMEACHGNRRRNDNRLSNLRWDTRQANHDDAMRHGTHPKGELNGNATFSADEIMAIRHEVAAGASMRRVGAKHGVRASTICNIVKGRSWKHLPFGSELECSA